MIFLLSKVLFSFQLSHFGNYICNFQGFFLFLPTVILLDENCAFQWFSFLQLYIFLNGICSFQSILTFKLPLIWMKVVFFRAFFSPRTLSYSRLNWCGGQLLQPRFITINTIILLIVLSILSSPLMLFRFVRHFSFLISTQAHHFSVLLVWLLKLLGWIVSQQNLHFALSYLYFQFISCLSLFQHHWQIYCQKKHLEKKEHDSLLLFICF